MRFDKRRKQGQAEKKRSAKDGEGRGRQCIDCVSLLLRAAKKRMDEWMDGKVTWKRVMDLKRGERDWYLSAPFLWWFQSVTSCDQGVKEFRSQWVGGERHFLNLVWPAPSCYLMATKWKIGRFQPAFFRRVSLFFCCGSARAAELKGHRRDGNVSTWPDGRATKNGH